MAEELLSLKWNNHQSHFVDILTFLREQEIFIDATLACGGKLYPAHKFVLSTCSDYFKQMFTKNPNKHPIVFMKDVSCRDLEALLDFMYNGEVNVPQSSLGSLIKTAEGLQIKGLAVPDDPPISNKREAALLRDRRELKTVRDNSYSPSPKRLRGRDKSPPLYSSRSKSPNSMSLHPSTTAAVASLAAVVSAEANAAAADEDSRTSAISDHSAAHVAGNSTAPKPNANSHLNSEDSASLSDNISRVSNRDPSPGPSGLKNILLHSKEEELDIKQEDVVDLGDAEGDWGGGDDGRDESLDDGGGGDSLTSENNAPNFSDVLGPPSDGSLNTSGDPAMCVFDFPDRRKMANWLDMAHKLIPSSFGSYKNEMVGGEEVVIPPLSTGQLWYHTSLSKQQQQIRKETWTCDLCSKLFVSRYYYERHMKCHLSQKEECPFCPFRSTYKWNLKSHIRKKHTDLHNSV